MQARYERIAQLLSLSGYAFAASALQSRRTPSRPRFAFWPLPGDWAKAGAPRRAARIAAVMSVSLLISRWVREHRGSSAHPRRKTQRTASSVRTIAVGHAAGRARRQLLVHSIAGSNVCVTVGAWQRIRPWLRVNASTS